MSDLQRGDRVKFLNDTSSGVITRIIDRDMVMVRTDDGFEYPVVKAELLKSVVSAEDIWDEPAVAASPAESNKALQDEDPQLKDDHMIIPDIESVIEDPGDSHLSVLLAIEPHHLSEPVTGEVDVFLINDSSFHLLFHIGTRIHRNKISTLSHGYLEPDTKYLIGNYHIDDLFEGNRGLKISVILYRAGNYADIDPIVYDLKPESDFLISGSAYCENDFTENRAMLVSLTESKERKTKIDSEMLREAMMTPKRDISDTLDMAKRPKNQSNKGIEEVDLHIDSIIDDSKGMSSGEIVDIQLGRFRTALEGAILSGQKRIIFIHGIGAGKLKHEIRKIVDQEYKMFRYQDASFSEYAYGATMVLLK